MEHHQFIDLKVSAALIIQKRMINQVDMQEYVREISTYIHAVDNLYIYNMTNQDLSEFYELLKNIPIYSIQLVRTMVKLPIIK